MHPADKFEAEYYEKHGHYPSIREVWDAAQAALVKARGEQ